MLKILIVDDEYQIREGMRSFPWEQYGCEIAGFSEDGEEALLKSRLFSEKRKPIDRNHPAYRF